MKPSGVQDKGKGGARARGIKRGAGGTAAAPPAVRPFEDASRDQSRDVSESLAMNGSRGNRP